MTQTRNVGPRGAPRRIVFAFMTNPFTYSDQQQPNASLARAHALARQLDAALHVVAVTKPREPFSPAVPLSVTRARVARWIAKLTDEHTAVRVTASDGSFLDDVATLARALNAELIIVVPPRRHFGRSVTKLVRSTSVPVLAMREAGSTSSTIVAATDLVKPFYPVLRAAMTLGGLLHAPVVAVHNVHPFTGVGGARLLEPSSVSNESAHARELARRTRQLQLVTQAGVLGLSSERAATVATRVSTRGAILRAARAHNARMIVVGARMQKRIWQALRASLAARVVDAANCSVLVTPVRAPDPHHHVAPAL